MIDSAEVEMIMENGEVKVVNVSRNFDEEDREFIRSVVGSGELTEEYIEYTEGLLGLMVDRRGAFFRTKFIKLVAYELVTRGGKAYATGVWKNLALEMYLGDWLTAREVK